MALSPEDIKVLASSPGTINLLTTGSAGSHGGGLGTYIGLSDTPSAFVASAIPHTNVGATALVHDAALTFDGDLLGLDRSGADVTVFGVRKGAAPTIDVGGTDQEDIAVFYHWDGASDENSLRIDRGARLRQGITFAQEATLISQLGFVPGEIIWSSSDNSIGRVYEYFGSGAVSLTGFAGIIGSAREGTRDAPTPLPAGSPHFVIGGFGHDTANNYVGLSSAIAFMQSKATPAPGTAPSGEIWFIVNDESITDFFDLFSAVLGPYGRLGLNTGSRDATKLAINSTSEHGIFIRHNYGPAETYPLRIHNRILLGTGPVRFGVDGTFKLVMETNVLSDVAPTAGGTSVQKQFAVEWRTTVEGDPTNACFVKFSNNPAGGAFYLIVRDATLPVDP